MKRCSGFTLVEMVVVLTLVGVTSIAAHSWSRDWMASARVSSATSEMVSSIWLARSEAVKRRSRVVLCKTVDGIVCTDVGAWDQGWIVFQDENNDRIRQAAELVLSHRAALHSGTKLSGNGPVATYVSFSPVGSTLTVGGAFQAGTLTVCEESATEGPARQIIIAAGGRPRVLTTRVATCP